MSIAIIGCTTVDLIFPAVPRLPEWPRHTEFTPDNLLLLPTPPIFSIGGNGANAAYVAARSGQAVSLHSNIGRDTLGTLARHWLESTGCRVLSSDRGHTAVNVTVANQRHQRATFFYAGETVAFPSRRHFRAHDFVLVCGWPHPSGDQLAQALPLLKRSGKFIALDAGPLLGPTWSRDEFEQILKGLSLFIANEHEIKTLTATTTLTAALKALRRTFSGQVILKRGRDGAVWSASAEARPVAVRAPKVKAISTVGAGDSFNGALMAALSAGQAMPKAIALACRIASSVVASATGVTGARPYRLTPR